MGLDLSNIKTISAALSGTVIKKVIQRSDSAVLWQAGAIVSYVVDTGVSYTEEVDSGASCLSPTTFTPAKSGWTFVGWREDGTASSSVLTSKVMGTDPIVLYAVFEQDVTLTCYDGGLSRKQVTTASRYYNNGNENNPSYVMTQKDYENWSSVGWATDDAANAPIVYNNGSTITLNGDLTIYGRYNQTITVTYYDNSTAAKTKTGTRYNSSSDKYLDPSFTLTQASVSGWTARGWSTGTAGNSSVTYNNNTAFTRTSNVTLYGSYSKTVTVTYYNNSTTASTTSGTAYRNYAGTETGASFTLTQAASTSGWTTRGWSTTNKGNASITYNNATAFTRTSDVTLYGLYQQTITLTTVANGSSTKHTGTRYWAPAGYINATFTVSDPTKSGATFKGWSTSSSSTTVSNSSISNLSLSASTTRYAVFKINDVTTTAYGVGGQTKDVTVYIDNTLYSTLSLTHSNMAGSYCYASLWTSSGTLIIYIEPGSGSATVTKDVSTLTSGNYIVRAASSYDNSCCNATLKMTGKTIVG